jgi:hypothetical protein
LPAFLNVFNQITAILGGMVYSLNPAQTISDLGDLKIIKAYKQTNFIS